MKPADLEKRRARVRRVGKRPRAPLPTPEVILKREPDPSVTDWLARKLLEIFRRGDGG